MSLSKRDVQLFLKRLRKLHPRGTAIKYYLCGEYGGRTARPHYHIILFNADQALIQPAWNLGNVHYGVVSGASIGYTLKYISKPSRIPLHQRDDRVKEFPLMSKGLGLNYLTPQMVAWHEAKPLDRMYCTLPDGVKVAMPRYYKQKIYTPNDLETINAALSSRAETKLREAMDKNPNYFRDLAELHKQQFRNFANKSKLRDNL